MGRSFFQVVLLSAWLVPLMGSAQGSLVYVPHHTGSLFGHQLQYYDLNADGQPEFSIYSRFLINSSGGTISFQTSYLNGFRVATDGYYFGGASFLNAGEEISHRSIPVRTNWEQRPELRGTRNWVGEDLLYGFGLGGLGYSFSGDIYESGIWGQSSSIVAIQMPTPEGYLNGWIRFEEAVPGSPYTLRVADWAYNPIPNQPILAGLLQVPEPGLVCLLLFGTGLLLLAVRRN